MATISMTLAMLTAAAPPGTAGDVDGISIAFSANSMVLLRIIIACILFGIALDTSPADFKRAATRPKAILVGVGAQFLLLPGLTFLLTLLLGVRGSIALGMILVACCPPGNVSNIVTHQAKGDVALSVSMTAVSNLLSIVAMPLNFALWGSLHPTGGAIMRSIDLSAMDMLVEVVLVIGVPFALGIGVARAWPRLASRSGRIVSPVAFLALAGLIAVALAGNWALFVAWIGTAAVAVFLHDTLAMALGYGIARVFSLPPAQRKAMTFEVGVRNAGLGLLLVFSFFGGLGGMALVAAWWGIWDIIQALALARVWRWRTSGQQVDLRREFENPCPALKTVASRRSRGVYRRDRRPLEPSVVDERGRMVRAVGMTQTFLSPAQVDELVASYESGATLVELGERFSIHRRTAAAHLVRRSVPIRQRGLNECHLAEAVELYDEGLTLMEVGLRYGVSQQAVRRALAVEGVTIRPAGRRAQAVATNV